VNGILPAQNSVSGGLVAILNMVKNIRIPQKAGNLLNVRKTDRFSQRILLHEVSYFGSRLDQINQSEYKHNPAHLHVYKEANLCPLLCAIPTPTTVAYTTILS
jgi:hypothetical protein